jgi:hypothetical protein
MLNNKLMENYLIYNRNETKPIKTKDEINEIFY